MARNREGKGLTRQINEQADVGQVTEPKENKIDTVAKEVAAVVISKKFPVLAPVARPLIDMVDRQLKKVQVVKPRKKLGRGI